MIMNEIFGEENFVAVSFGNTAFNQRGMLKKFSVHHNYTLCYQKSNDYSLIALERTEEHNKIILIPIMILMVIGVPGDVRNALYRKNLIYDIITPHGKVIHAPKNGWR